MCQIIQSKYCVDLERYKPLFNERKEKENAAYELENNTRLLRAKINEWVLNIGTVGNEKAFAQNEIDASMEGNMSAMKRKRTNE